MLKKRLWRALETVLPLSGFTLDAEENRQTVIHPVFQSQVRSGTPGYLSTNPKIGTAWRHSHQTQSIWMVKTLCTLRIELSIHLPTPSTQWGRVGYFLN